MPAYPADDFRDRFVVRVEHLDRPQELLGSGVLLTPTVVATCRHVLAGLEESKARVRLGTKSVGVILVTWPDDGEEHRRDPDQDVAFLLLDGPLGPEAGPFPALVRGSSSATHDRLAIVLADEPDMLMSCGHQRGGPKLARASIDSFTRNHEGCVDWVRLGQSHRKGESGGPVWLVPPETLPDQAASWQPGLVLGLIAQSARDEAPGRTPSGGPPHSFAVTSDTLLALRDALCERRELSNSQLGILAEIRTIPAARAADWAEQPVDELVRSAELQQYLRKAESLHKELPLVGFETKVHVSITIDDLYVSRDAMIDESADPSHPWSFEDAQEAAWRQGLRWSRDQISLAEAFTVARAKNQRGVLLLGNPGSGKTTHLKRVLLEIKRQGPQSLGLPPGTVPVFLALRNLRVEDGGLPGLMERELRNPFGGIAPDLGARLCKRGRLLFLLDGLDEVADAEQRALVTRWIDDARRADDTNLFLVSCRFTGYTADARIGPGFLELHLRPLDDEQVRVFVHNWYRAVESVGASDPLEAEQRAHRAAEALVELLEAPERSTVSRIYALTHHPLLLTAICLLHQRRGTLPEKRWLLYHEAVEVLLERWRKLANRLDVTFPSEVARRVLEPLALWMHEERERTRATRQELVEPVTGALKGAGLETVGAERFLELIRDEAGLLTSWGEEHFGFVHLCFQEYLAAQAIRGRAFEEAELLKKLARWLGDCWWQEIILLTLVQDDRQLFLRFMEAVAHRLEVSSTTSRSTEDRRLEAMVALEQAMPYDFEELKDALQRHPSQEVRAWLQAWQEEKDRAARAEPDELVPQGLVPIPGGHFSMGSSEDEEGRAANEGPQKEIELPSFFLSRYPVTNEQYAIYLKANPKAPKPRFWADPQYNHPRQPVIGVSWHEATAYCRWAGLSLPTETQWEYACRGGAATRYSLGDHEEDLAKAGWYRSNSGGRLHTVGEKQPNGFGLYDMHGNVYEWCSSSFESYAITPVPEDHPGDEVASNTTRVIRGGSFRSLARHVRSASRFRHDPAVRGLFVGFRPCLVKSDRGIGSVPSRGRSSLGALQGLEEQGSDDWPEPVAARGAETRLPSSTSPSTEALGVLKLGMPGRGDHAGSRVPIQPRIVHGKGGWLAELPHERLAQALAGDRQAFTELYVTYDPVVRSAVAAAIRRRPELELELELEDFVAEIWKRFLEGDCWRLRKYDPSRGAFGWFLRMRAFATTRALMGQRAYCNQPVEIPDPLVSMLGDVEGSMRRDALVQLWTAMEERLDGVDLVLFRGVFVEGRLVREVAKELGLSEAMVLRRSHRLKRKIERIATEHLGLKGLIKPGTP